MKTFRFSNFPLYPEAEPRRILLIKQSLPKGRQERMAKCELEIVGKTNSKNTVEGKILH